MTSEEAVARAMALIKGVEPVLLYHETGGHSGDGSDHALAVARDALATAKAALSVMPAQGWRDIASAPRNGTEILAYRDDCGVLLVRWTAAAEFLTDAELEEWDESTAHKEDWFCADFITGCRLENDLLPTHWQPLPAPPTNEQED